MAETEGIVVQQDKTEKVEQAENKDVCVTCQHHAPKGHGEWWMCMYSNRRFIIRVPGLHFASIRDQGFTVGFVSYRVLDSGM